MINATYRTVHQPEWIEAESTAACVRNNNLHVAMRRNAILLLTTFGKTLVTMNLNQSVHKNFPSGCSSFIVYAGQSYTSFKAFTMYEAFYGLREKPFSILPDPDLIYWCQNHRLAFAMLEFGVMNSAGFTVITGEIGCGKTTLIRYLLRKLDHHVTTCLISNTPRARTDCCRGF